MYFVFYIPYFPRLFLYITEQARNLYWSGNCVDQRPNFRGFTYSSLEDIVSLNGSIVTDVTAVN